MSSLPKVRHHPTGVALILLVALLPAVQPLLLGCLPRFDAPFHLYRLAALERALLHGDLYPRWLTDLGLGFGFPLFNYYAPLGYYLTLPLRLLGLSFETTLLGGFVMTLGLLAVGTYLWTRDLFGHRAGFVAAFAVSYAPYPLLDVHYRGAFAEVWGLACLSLSLWLVGRLARRGGWGLFVATTLAAAALMLSHNVVALLGMPLLFGYALFLAIAHRERGTAMAALPAALFAGMALSAFFWVPALLEQEYVKIHQLRIYDYREHFLALAELFGGPHPTDPALANRYVPHSVGWGMPALALLAWLPYVTRGSWFEKGPRGRALAHLAALTLVTLLLLAMTLPVSAPLWARLPLLAFLQFPWRFLGPASLGLALLAGAGAARLPGPDRLWVPLLLAALATLSLTWLFPPCSPPQPPLTPPNLIRIEGQTGGLGTTTAGDYLPRAVEERPAPDALLAEYDAAAPDYVIPRLDPAALPPDARVVEEEYGLTDARVVLETEAPFRARFRWYYFPGWQARIDGVPVAAGPLGPHGLLAVDVPSGRHTLEVAFGDTPLRRTVTTLSTVTLLALVGLTTWRWGRPAGRPAGEEGQGPRRPPRVDGVLFLAVALVGAGLFGVKTFYLERRDNPLRPQDFDGARLRDVDVPLHLRFGDDLVLLGYDLDAPTLSSDDPLDLILYWHTLPPVDANYSVAVHLVDEEGHLYGQADNQNPGGYPTQRLLPGEYLRDPHPLEAFAGAPPGPYTLTVTVHDPQTEHSLEVWSADGRWLGVQYALAQVNVVRPESFPHPEALPVERETRSSVARGLRLVGTNEIPTATQVGATFPLVLFWEALEPPDDDHRVRIRLADADGVPAFEKLAWPGRADHPTSEWRAGEVIRDAQDVPVPPVRRGDRRSPLVGGRYTLQVALVGEGEAILGPTVDLGELTVTVPERAFRLPETARPLDLRLGEVATLAGYEHAEGEVRPGESVDLTLYWRAEEVVDISYTVFVHLLDAQGQIVAQRDRQPGGGARPTTSWLPDEVVEDGYTVTVPPGTPAGTYVLKVGMYHPRTLQRLPVTDGEGRLVGDGALPPVAVRVTEE